MVKLSDIVLIVTAYMIGSIPTAVWIGRVFFRTDIREHGSGNAGATNTLRTLGKKAGLVVLIIDILKGWLAVGLICLSGYASGSAQWILLEVTMAIAAILGHIFPIYVGFKGGKGVATLFGMILAIQPLVALYCVGVFLLCLYLTRFVSLSSILASIAFAVLILFIFNEKEPLYRFFSIAVALLVILTHQKNISRMLRGSESKIPILKYRDKKRPRRAGS